MNGVAPHPSRPAPGDPESARRSPDGRGGTPWTSAFAETLSGGRVSVRDLLLGGARTEALGSNNWVVDGTLTASGKPLLANDPHLATHIPSLWYLAHLSGGDFEVIGATLPGAPAVAIGRNRYIAWGETNVAADVQDLYRERLNQAGDAAEFRGVAEPLRIIDEEIKVKGDETVHVKVRLTRHGPLVSDAINANNAASTAAVKPPPIEPLAFRWTALDDEDRTIVAFLKLNEARNWTDFTSALADFAVPSQNFVYADVDGHIGYYLPGRIPIRARGDGTQACRGLDRRDGVDRLDPVCQSAAHIRSAPALHRHSQQSADAARLSILDRPRVPGAVPGAAHHGPVAPARRIDARRHAAVSVRHLFTSRPDAAAIAAAARLRRPTRTTNWRWICSRSWNYDAAGDNIAAALYEAWFLKLVPVIAGDDLGARVLERYEGRYSYVTRFLTATLHPERRHVVRRCDDAGEGDVSTVGDQGAARRRRRPPRRARRRHEGMAVERRASRRLSASGSGRRGDAAAAARPIGAGSRRLEHGERRCRRRRSPYEQRALPGYRQIIDLSPRNDSRFLDAVGQSGHFLSPRYDDFLKDWQAVRHRPMRMERPAIEAGALGTLRLTPGRASPAHASPVRRARHSDHRRSHPRGSRSRRSYEGSLPRALTS